MTIGDRVRALRISKGWTQSELAEKMGYKSKSSIAHIENGRDIPRSMVVTLADILDTSPSYLMGWEDEAESLNREPNPLDEQTIFDRFDNIKPLALKKFPMLGEIACGEPIYADEDKETYVMADSDIKADFCLKAKGESMINARIYDGDLVFIKKMPMVENGDIAAVIIEAEATLKRVYYYPEQNKLILNPENSAFDPLVYIGEELNHIHILGKAVFFMSAL